MYVPQLNHTQVPSLQRITTMIMNNIVINTTRYYKQPHEIIRATITFCNIRLITAINLRGNGSTLHKIGWKEVSENKALSTQLNSQQSSSFLVIAPMPIFPPSRITVPFQIVNMAFPGYTTAVSCQACRCFSRATWGRPCCASGRRGRGSRKCSGGPRVHLAQ